MTNKEYKKFEKKIDKLMVAVKDSRKMLNNRFIKAIIEIIILLMLNYYLFRKNLIKEYDYIQNRNIVIGIAIVLILLFFMTSIKNSIFFVMYTLAIDLFFIFGLFNFYKNIII